ncbi:MAG: zinc ribbon domain-containing protein [Elusimicrobia bacterium]|nr:zinc ribbon domain-containing protein [Elusimicrobiota bacterium]
MKCLNCGQENRATLKFCKKCGRDLTAPPIWFPDWKWHLKTLSWIYISVTALFFAVSYLLHKLPPPYNQRQIPAEMTPWLNPHKVPAP